MDKKDINLYESLTEMNQPYSITDEKYSLESPSDDTENEDEPTGHTSKKSRPSQTARLRKQNEELMNRLVTLEKNYIDLQKNHLENEETKLKLVKTNLNWAKVAAEKENDLTTRTEAEEALDDVKLKMYELQQQKKAIAQTPQNYGYNSYSAPTINEEADNNYMDFLERNPVFNINDRSNPNFSQDAFNLVNNLSSRLSIQYKSENRGDEEFSQRYFQDLENMFKNEISGGSMQNNQSYRRGGVSAPVSRSIGRRANKDDLTLTEDEQRAFNGFMRHAINDEHREAIRKRYINAKRNNFQNPNINAPYSGGY